MLFIYCIESEHRDVQVTYSTTYIVDDFCSEATKSAFDEKTDKASSQQYFHYYGQLAQQQNMLQDLVRTGTYQRAMLSNDQDFKDAVVLDVGAGTGILSHFALQAGARKVYSELFLLRSKCVELFLASMLIRDFRNLYFGIKTLSRCMLSRRVILQRRHANLQNRMDLQINLL